MGSIITDSKLQYQEWLQGDTWKAQRFRVIKKNQGKCCICGHKSVHNDVHHVIYRDNWDHTKDADLRVLCRRCHEVAHKAIDILGGAYKNMDLDERWRETLATIWNHELLPKQYKRSLDKKAKKKKKPKVNQGSVRRCPTTPGFEKITPEFMKVYMRALNKRQAELLGVSFPLASGWKQDVFAMELPTKTLNLLVEYSSTKDKPHKARGDKPNKWGKKARKRADRNARKDASLKKDGFYRQK